MSNFFQKVKDGASKAAEKASQTLETTKLSAQISGKRKLIGEWFEEIGAAVYEGFQNGDPAAAEEKALALCAQVSAAKQEVAELEIKIKQLKNEKDCVCGRTVPLETAFCPSCGHKFA
jgi:hypothetical protein